jgi:hypothetical protein
VSEVQPEGGDIISTTKKVSPPQDPQIHAQTNKSGDGGDVGDIFPLTVKDSRKKQSEVNF